MAAYGVSQEEVTRQLQWHCGRGSGVGIANLGNTCFVSAVAQVLLRLAPFRRLLCHHDLNCPYSAETCAACALAAQATALDVQGGGVDTDAPLAAAARAGLFQNEEFARINATRQSSSWPPFVP